jgi:hypothetical protein
MSAQALVRCVTALAAVGLASAAARPAHAQVILTLAPGANSRGYIQADQGRVGSTQTCGAGSAFNAGSNRLFDVGNRFFASGTGGCVTPGATGFALMEATSARTLRAAGGWTTDPDGKVSSGVSANGQAVNSLTAFSSIAYQDRMTILAGGAQPDSVRFSFLLTGEVRNALGANARSRPSADLEMIWDSEFAPGFSQGFVEAPGSYTFTFALTPSAIGRAITFASRLSTFSIFEAIDPTQPFFGSTTTDFANTSTLLQLQFLRADGTGQGVDITADVRYATLSGTDYVTPLQVIPEPATVALAGVGLLALGAGARVRRRGGGTPAPR